MTWTWLLQTVGAAVVGALLIKGVESLPALKRAAAERRMNRVLRKVHQLAKGGSELVEERELAKFFDSYLLAGSLALARRQRLLVRRVQDREDSWTLTKTGRERVSRLTGRRLFGAPRKSAVPSVINARAGVKVRRRA